MEAANPGDTAQVMDWLQVMTPGPNVPQTVWGLAISVYGWYDEWIHQ